MSFAIRSLRRIGRVVGDVKALGASAPLRAAYEASKSSNFHQILFRDIDPAKVPRSKVLDLGVVIPTSQQVHARCLKDAHKVVEEGTRVFDRRTATGSLAPWSLDPLVNKMWPQGTRWWRIDIRSDARLSDVKFVWEAGRHRDLVVLARAAVIEPGGPWFEHLATMLDRWVTECPPERGVHWYSSLELALRAVAWAQVIALVGNRIDDPLRARMDHHLMASARHITIELPYTVSSMKNNHLLGDGLGLVVLGMMFPEHGSKWRRVGDRLMTAQLRRHMRPDGSMIEDSLSYHRFVLEMLIVRCLLGNAPDEVESALERAGLSLVQLGVTQGPVPQFGDWDEGRVLADSGEAGSTAGSAWAALALSGYEVPVSLLDEYDELAWYIRPSQGGRLLPRFDDAWMRTGYFIRITAGGRKIWFKTAGGPSHQHADISSIWILEDERWLLEDPGTGTYNGPLQIRNGFRTSAAHPVRVPAGADQLVPHRAFRWLRSVRASVSCVESLGNCTAVLSVHDAFQHEHGRVARVLLATPTGVAVVDVAERAMGTWTMTVPMGPGSAVEEFYGLDGAVLHRGNASEWLGWRSPTYGTWKESTWATVSGPFQSQLRWGIGEPPDVVVEMRWGKSSVQAHLTSPDKRSVLVAVGV